MMKRNLSNRDVLLGVTGSIAAYKACDIASRLVKLGVRVTPALTNSATQLVCPASFEAITGNRAITAMFEPLPTPEIEHIAVATRANLFLIAPATANILAKAAHGIADDWLSTTLLATRAPILFAPAMNTNMYLHPATQSNIDTLRERGCHFAGPDEGALACGTQGPGRMAEPALVVETALPLLDPRNDLDGVHVVVTSGGTREPVDPVRYLGNRSSGKMGRAIAFEALCRGAKVTVVSGPASTPLPCAANVIDVETAAEMDAACRSLAPEAEVFIAAAAVADYRIDEPLESKHKRSGGPLELRLVENPDILASVAQAKRPGQIVVGFAAETEDMAVHGQAKLASKNLDMVVANLVGQPGSGFGTDTVRATLICADGAEELSPMSKEELAQRLFDRVTTLRAGSRA